MPGASRRRLEAGPAPTQSRDEITMTTSRERPDWSDPATRRRIENAVVGDAQRLLALLAVLAVLLAVICGVYWVAFEAR